MKKVAYSVSRQTKEGRNQLKGIGYLSETDLIIACKSKNGNPYIRVFEDCVKACSPIPLRENEYSGIYYEIREIEVEKKTSSGQDVGMEKIEVMANYYIWYKFVD